MLTTPQCKDWRPSHSLDARHNHEDAIPMLSEEMPRSINREETPDLRSQCPVCGNPYRPSEDVVALASLSFVTETGPSAPPALGSDSGSKILLGHHGCVLPRLLTLLAGFRPEIRFVKAFTDLATGEDVSPTNHEEP